MSAPHLKHTPGPWTAKPISDEFINQFDDHDVNIVTSDGLACAVSICQGDITEDMAKANANLIAAAPDLLAALINLANSFRNADAAIAEAKARAAINKATGR